MNGDSVAVYNMHLTWPIGNRRLPRQLTPGPLRLLTGYEDQQRNREVEILASYLQQEKLPFIAAGDFNLSEHAVTYQKLADVAHDTFRETARGWGNTWRLHPALPPLLRIDYVWHSEAFVGLKAERVPGLPSDHSPVVAWLQIR